MSGCPCSRSTAVTATWTRSSCIPGAAAGAQSVSLCLCIPRVCRPSYRGGHLLSQLIYSRPVQCDVQSSDCFATALGRGTVAVPRAGGLAA